MDPHLSGGIALSWNHKTKCVKYEVWFYQVQQAKFVRQFLPSFGKGYEIEIKLPPRYKWKIVRRNPYWYVGLKCRLISSTFSLSIGRTICNISPTCNKYGGLLAVSEEYDCVIYLDQSMESTFLQDFLTTALFSYSMMDGFFSRS